MLFILIEVYCFVLVSLDNGKNFGIQKQSSSLCFTAMLMEVVKDEKIK